MSYNFTLKINALLYTKQNYKHEVTESVSIIPIRVSTIHSSVTTCSHCHQKLVRAFLISKSNRP